MAKISKRGAAWGAATGLLLGVLMFSILRKQDAPADGKDLIGAALWLALGVINLYRLFRLAAFPERFAGEPPERAREAAKLCLGAMAAIGLLAPQPVKLGVLVAIMCLVFAIWLRIPARLFGQPTES